MFSREKRKPSVTRRMIVMLILVGLLLFLLVGWNVMGKIGMKKFMASMKEPPQTVSATKAEYSEWQPVQTAVGSLRAVRGADLALEVAGVVAAVHLKSGDDVKAGQPLLDLIDADEAAQLKQLKANAALANVTFDRAKRQMDVEAISKADYDAATADLKAKQAAVAQQEAVVAKKHLSAPFDGRAGIITLSKGAYVSAGTTVTTVQQLDPLYVDFFVPQRHLGLLKIGQKVTLGLDAFGGKSFEGSVNAVDPKVDGDTRNVKVEATVPNPDRLLLPGMFADVSVDVGEKKRQLTLPQTAVTFNPYGETVFVVHRTGKKDDTGQPEMPTAQQVFVTTGDRRGDQVAIVTGVKEGDEVVTSGQLKLKNGTPLIIDNSVSPPNSPNPTPQEH
jgi:membrane fusion protein (multidrug efflux system)